MPIRNPFAFLALLLLAFAAGAPASAQTARGENVSSGGAIAAKVIGEKCAGSLTAAEIGELDAYLARDAVEAAKDGEAKAKTGGYNAMSMPQFQASLTETLRKKYSDPANCNDTTAAQARDMLQRVRKVMTSGEPLYPTAARP